MPPSQAACLAIRPPVEPARSAADDRAIERRYRRAEGSAESAVGRASDSTAHAPRAAYGRSSGAPATSPAQYPAACLLPQPQGGLQLAVDVCASFLDALKGYRQSWFFSSRWGGERG